MPNKDKTKVKDAVLLVRIAPALMERFKKAKELDAQIHNFEELDTSKAVRQLLMDYCARVESTAESDVAMSGAKVLAGRRR